MVKQVQQDRPMRRHPDRSCTYLVLRATPDERSVQLKPALKFPRGGAAKDSSSDQHFLGLCEELGNLVELQQALAYMVANIRK